jgi:hypothetical protein
MEVVHAKIGQNTQEVMHNIHVILEPPPTEQRRSHRVGSDLPHAETRHLTCTALGAIGTSLV